MPAYKRDPEPLGISSIHPVESEAALSGLTAEIPAAASTNSANWFVLIDDTHVDAVSEVEPHEERHRTRFQMSSHTCCTATKISAPLMQNAWELHEK
jgi:hypothetical protein